MLEEMFSVNPNLYRGGCTVLLLVIWMATVGICFLWTWKRCQNNIEILKWAQQNQQKELVKMDTFIINPVNVPFAHFVKTNANPMRDFFLKLPHQPEELWKTIKLIPWKNSLPFQKKKF